MPMLIAALLLLALPCAAADTAVVAGVRGEPTVSRDGASTPLTRGDAVAVGDRITTDATSRVKVLLADDSVLSIGSGTEVVIDELLLGSERRGRLRVLAGRFKLAIAAWLSGPSDYQIETPTAVAGVRGTAFFIEYDSGTETTDVVGIDGRIMVRSLSEVLNDTVYVTASEGTSVIRGRAPTKPAPVDPDYLVHESTVLQPLAVGGVGGVPGAASSVKAGENVPPPDRAPSSGGVAGQVGRDELRNAGDVAGQPPAAIDSRGQLGVP